MSYYSLEFAAKLADGPATSVFNPPVAVCADICPTCGYPADLNGDAECYECSHPSESWFESDEFEEVVSAEEKAWQRFDEFWSERGCKF